MLESRVQGDRVSDEDVRDLLQVRAHVLSLLALSQWNTSRIKCLGMWCCVRCKMARYCSRGCQKTDWTRHKAHCETVAFQHQGAPEGAS